MNNLLIKLQTLRAVAEHGGFGSAARALGVSQPVVSSHIRDLEHELQTSLIARTTRRVSVTDQGHAFLKDVAPHLDRLTEAMARGKARAKASAERLRIAAPPLLSASFLPSVIAGFARAHPTVSVELYDEPTERIVEHLTSGTVDAALGTLPDTVAVSSKTIVLRDRLVVVSASSESPKTWAGLVKTPLVLLSPGSGIRQLVDAVSRREGTQLEPTYQVGNVMTVLALVGAGLGASILPSYALTAPLSRDGPRK